MESRIWVTWELQRRNRTLSDYLGAELYEFDMKAPSLIRYPIVIIKTLIAITKINPSIIFAQNPSLMLSLFAVTVARLSNKKVVIDAHNAGLYPLEGRYRALNWVASKICKWADITIVSNDGLKGHVTDSGGTPVAIPDPLPKFRVPKSRASLSDKYNVLYICSWADDEPIREVLKASVELDKNVTIYITGNGEGYLQRTNYKLPEQVVLTGFVTEEEFTQLLYSCDCVMALTKRDNCLLCSAYESVAAEKPLVLTGTEALREYFSGGCVYTNNDSLSLVEAITSMQKNHIPLSKDMVELKRKLEAGYETIIEEFESAVRLLN